MKMWSVLRSWVALFLLLRHSCLGKGGPPPPNKKGSSDDEKDDKIDDKETLMGSEIVTFHEAGVIESLSQSTKGLFDIPYGVFRFIAEEELSTCRDFLQEADMNRDDMLNATEYSVFIWLMTDGVIEGEFQELDIILISTYYTVACQQCFQITQDDMCCVGPYSFIEISEDQEYDLMSEFLCSTVSTALIDMDLPTPAPSQLPPGSTTAPSQLEPTQKPSFRPTPSPTISQTDGGLEPSPAAQRDPLCITFLYTLENDKGLSADDIMNENGNTLRTGLEIATVNLTIQILNETFPRDDEPPEVNKLNDISAFNLFIGGGTRRMEQPVVYEQGTDKPKSNVTYSGSTLAMHKALSDLLDSTEDAASTLDAFFVEMHSPKGSRRPGKRRLTLRAVESSRNPHSRRRLVYYTDANPPEIINVIDNPFCPQGSDTEIQCAIVVTEVCVVLEEGDDATEIEKVLVDGFKAAIDSGEFFSLIPPEHIPV